jgi:hypothetical protein
MHTLAWEVKIWIHFQGKEKDVGPCVQSPVLLKGRWKEKEAVLWKVPTECGNFLLMIPL